MATKPDPLERLLCAIETGDAESAGACYAADARIWHNFDDVEQSPEENVVTLRWMCSNFPERRYEITHREALADGVLQQHRLHLRDADGREQAIPACIVARFAEDRIVRLDEYLDPAPFVRE